MAGGRLTGQLARVERSQQFPAAWLTILQRIESLASPQKVSGLRCSLDFAWNDQTVPLAKAARFACLCPHARRDSFVCCFACRCGFCLIPDTKIPIAFSITGLDAAGVSTSVDRDSSQFVD